MSLLTNFIGGVKSVQSGVTGSSGNITITSVDITRSIILSVSKGSSGTVAATGTVGASSITGNIAMKGDISGNNLGSTNTYNLPITGTSAASDISGGVTNLTTKQYSARLTTGTNIYTDGPVEWQVVEYF